MNTALSEVSIQRNVIAVRLQQLRELSQVLAYPLGGDRSILPSWPSVWPSWDVCRSAEARLSDFPKMLLFFGFVVDPMRLRAAMILGVATKRFCLSAGFSQVFVAELHEKPAISARKVFEILGVQVLLAHVIYQRLV